MNEGKRKRSANFTPEEKRVCLNLIKNYTDILNSKKANNAETWKEKEEAWNEIENEFNSLRPAGFRRTKSVLKNFYVNYKKRRKLPIKPKRRMSDGSSSSLDDFITNHSYDPTSVLHFSSPPNDVENDYDDEESNILPEDMISNLDSENIEIIQDDLVTEIDNENTESETEMEPMSNILPAKHKIKHHPETLQENKYEDKPPTSRCPITSTSALTRKYEKLATIKLECSQVQLDILKKEKECALLRLSKEKYANKRRREEDERKNEEYEYKTRSYKEQKEREDELFILRRQALLLDIKIKKAQLQKLNS